MQEQLRNTISHSDVPRKIISANVAIANTEECREKNKMVLNLGAGTVIGHRKSKTYILTANHATTRYKSDDICKRKLAIIVGGNNYKYPVIIEARDKNLDLAIVSIDKIKSKTADIDWQETVLNEDFIIIGHPSLPYPTVIERSSEYYYYSHDNPNIKKIVLNDRFLYGFSGGGAYIMKTQKLNMVCTHILPDDRNKGICISISKFKKVIQNFITE
jgi:hypothetical protein